STSSAPLKCSSIITTGIGHIARCPSRHLRRRGPVRHRWYPVTLAFCAGIVSVVSFTSTSEQRERGFLHPTPDAGRHRSMLELLIVGCQRLGVGAARPSGVGPRERGPAPATGTDATCAERLPLRGHDRLFWITLARGWRNWRTALVFVQPDTVVPQPVLLPEWHATHSSLFIGLNRYGLFQTSMRCRC